MVFWLMNGRPSDRILGIRKEPRTISDDLGGNADHITHVQSIAQYYRRLFARDILFIKYVDPDAVG